MQKRMITSLSGFVATPLGLAAGPKQDSRCVRRAFDGGINYFFFYGPEPGGFAKGLTPLLRKRRDELIVATGTGSRRPTGLRNARRRACAALGVDILDLFFAEYIYPGDDPQAIFAAGGVLDELSQWKSDGAIRYVGATVHDRALAKRLAGDPRVDVLMHRFNMAHRKALREVFPTALRHQTPVVAFTATRWGTLFEPPAGWTGKLPTAVDCYRYCLAHSAVNIVLTSPQTLAELDENLELLALPPMNKRDRAQWEQYGDLVHGHGTDAFETRWS